MSDQGQNSNQAVSAGRGTLLVVFLTVFIDLLGFGIVLPLLPRYGAWFSASGWQLGALMASFSECSFCLHRSGAVCPTASVDGPF